MGHFKHKRNQLSLSHTRSQTWEINCCLFITRPCLSVNAWFRNFSILMEKQKWSLIFKIKKTLKKVLEIFETEWHRSETNWMYFCFVLVLRTRKTTLTNILICTYEARNRTYWQNHHFYLVRRFDLLHINIFR